MKFSHVKMQRKKKFSEVTLNNLKSNLVHILMTIISHIRGKHTLFL